MPVWQSRDWIDQAVDVSATLGNRDSFFRSGLRLTRRFWKLCYSGETWQIGTAWTTLIWVQLESHPRYIAQSRPLSDKMNFPLENPNKNPLESAHSVLQTVLYFWNSPFHELWPLTSDKEWLLFRAYKSPINLF